MDGRPRYFHGRFREISMSFVFNTFGYFQEINKNSQVPGKWNLAGESCMCGVSIKPAFLVFSALVSREHSVNLTDTIKERSQTNSRKSLPWKWSVNNIRKTKTTEEVRTWGVRVLIYSFLSLRNRQGEGQGSYLHCLQKSQLHWPAKQNREWEILMELCGICE